MLTGCLAVADVVLDEWTAVFDIILFLASTRVVFSNAFVLCVRVQAFARLALPR